jgi:hypothetical protein
MFHCQWHRFGCPDTIPVGEETRHEEKCFHNGLVSKACPAGCPYYGPLLLSDGTDHHCIAFMTQIIRNQQWENQMQQRRIEYLQNEMDRVIREAKESREKLIESAARRISEVRAEADAKLAAAGDARN